MPRIDRLWYEIDAETRGFDEGILKSGDKLRNFTEYARGAPLAVLGALAAAAVVAGVKLAKMAADVEKQMAVVQTAAQVTKAELDDLQRGVLEVFTDLPIESVDELTRGLYDIVSSGIAAADSIDTLRIAAEAAVGGVTSVAVSVDALTSILNAYRGGNLTARDAADQLFQAVNLGKISFDEISQSIGNVVGIAASFNVSLTDVLASAAALSLNGIKAAEAITGIRSAFINISRPSEDFKRQFPELAAQFTEGRLRGDGFVQFLLDFQRESKGSSAALSTLFRDTQAYTAVVGLLRDEGVTLVELQGEIGNSSGAAAQATKTLTETTKAYEQLLKNELKVQLLDLGNNVLPAYNKGLEFTRDMLRAINFLISDTDYSKLLANLRELNAGSVLFDPAQMQRYRAQVLELMSDITDGQVDLSRLPIEQLRAVEEAAARVLAQNKRVTVDELRSAERIKDSLDPTRSLNERERAYQLIRRALSAADAQARTSADEAQKADEARRRSAAGALEVTREAATEVANQIQNYKDEAAAHVVAQRQKAAALAVVRQAQADLNAAVEEGRAAQARGDTQGVVAAAGRASAARAQIEAQRETVLNANKVLSEFARQVQDKVASLEAQLQGSIARATVSAVDDAEASIAALLAQVEQVRRDGGIIDQAQVERVVALTRNMAALKDALAETDRALADVQSAEFRGERDLERLSAEAQKLRLLRDQVTEADQLRQISDRLTEIERERRAISENIVANQRAIQDAIARILDQQTAQVRDLAGAINDSASAALSLAGAFGIVDDRIASVLQSAVQIGTQISVFQDELGKLGKTDGAGNALASIGSVVSAAVPIIDGLSSVLSLAFGDSPAEQERKRLQRENIDAIRDLTRQLGEFGLDIKGADFARFAEVAAAAVAAGNRDGRDSSSGIERIGERSDIRGFFAAQGIDPQEFREFAASLGISFESLIPTFAELRQLAEAIAATELTQFAVTFGGQLEALRAEFRLFNITDPIAQLEKLREVFSDPNFGAPALRQALAGLDLSTPEGRAAAQKALEALFTQLQAGTLDPAQLGGLTAQELLDAILETSDLLRTTAENEGTGGFNVSRTITEVTGSRIAGLLTTANVWAQQTAESTAIMAAALTRAGLPSSISPPTVSVTDTVPRGLQQFIVNLTIPAGMTPQQASAIGTAITDPLIAEIDRQLGIRVQRLTRAGGSALLT